VIRGLKRPLAIPIINRIGFWMMVAGLVTAAIPLLGNKASVLPTDAGRYSVLYRSCPGRCGQLG
jgi:hypothetical protein